MKCDIVIDNSAGDSGKGKVVHFLLKNGNYTHCVRGNGANNCGHTIYHNGVKFTTHAIPAGVFFGVKSIIGPGCVLNVKAFFEELNYLKSKGIDCENLVKIAHNVHIVTDSHLNEDSNETKIGTTKRGVGQAYRDKYARTGFRAEDVKELKNYLCDFYDECFNSTVDPYILYEGAQGFTLDIDHGDYPYVTSSHTTTAGALLNGIPYTAINEVYGCSKAYDTYVGSKQFQLLNNKDLVAIQLAGNEVGATTGRIRQCNYLNIDNLIKSININCVSRLIINKMDILQQVNCWKVIYHDEIIDLLTEDAFKEYLNNLTANLNKNIKINFSYSPEYI